MDTLEKWMEKNQKLCVITGIFGLLVSPFLWPFFVAILFQFLSLMVPVLLACFLIKQPWLEKQEENGNEKRDKNEPHGADADTGKNAADGTAADDQSEERKQKEQESVKAGDRKTEVPDEAACLAILWYQNEGRERILRIRERLEREGRKEFSVSRDGICTVRQEKSFQRVGILRGYPGRNFFQAEAELKKDGFSIRQAGDFVWISWK